MIDLADRLVIKDGNVFAVIPRAGAWSGADGVWMDDCRHISHHELRIDGAPPRPVAADDEAGHTTVHRYDGDARLERRVHADGTMVERIVAPGAIELAAEGDFVTIFGLRGIVARTPRDGHRTELRIDGAPPRPVAADDEAGHTTVHRYAGDARLERRVHADGTMVERVVAPGAIELATEGDFVTIFGLRGIVARTPRDGHRTELRRHVSPGELRVEYRFTPAPRAPSTAAFEPPRVECDSERFAAVLRRAFADMRMLLSSLDGEPYFAAGVPWYATLFGRDSLIAALQLMAYAPEVAAGTLRLLAGRIGRRADPEREEEPGKILHELRPGETATPLARYYGSVDATPLFVLALEATGDAALQARLRPAADAARGWIARRDPLTYTAGALRHQGWKDSEDGVPVPHPVALIEPQAYAGRDVEPFWLAHRGFYAMALGTDVLASNQGHALWATRVAPARARAIRDALMGPAMFSGWGIRTLADDEPIYDPLSYHRGSVWPHDTALIAAGLRRHGFGEDFLTLFDALVDAAAAAPGGRLPELFGGQPRVAGEPFVPYPVACRPQAWAAGAIPFLVAEGLGLNDRRDERGAAVLPSGVGELRIDGVVHASRTTRGEVAVRLLA